MNFRLPCVAILLFALLVAVIARPSHAQLRIVSYNAAANPAGNTARAGTDTVLRAIGIENKNGISRPADIISLQEIDTGLQGATSIVNALNAIYGPGTYARSTVAGSGTNPETQAVVYNTHTVSLVSQAAIGTASVNGAARQPMRYEFRPVGYDDSADFYVYSSHFKAGSTSTDQTRRNVESQMIRTDAATLGANARIIYTGDFNIQSSSEAMYQTLLAAGSGKAVDPINTPGSWNNNSGFAAVHTQAPLVTGVNNLTGGGMDDRFDFQLVTEPLMSGNGLSYIGPGVPNTLISPTQHSYRAFGNNGTTFNNNLNAAANTALPISEYNPGLGEPSRTTVLNALTTASDHLPVVADYQIPARMNAVATAAPAQVILGSTPTVTLSVNNSAPVAVAIGADELIYNAGGTGSVGGTASGTSLALAAANQHSFVLDASTLGPHNGTLGATSSSVSVANGTFSQPVSYTVLDHSVAEFTTPTALQTLTIDFGTVLLSSGSLQEAFQITNLPGAYRAGLDLNGYSESGDAANRFSIDLSAFSDLAAGSVSGVFNAFFSIDQPGTFFATYLIDVADHAGIFGGTADTLTLNLTGTVAVPEPSTWLMAATGLTALGWFGRKRACRPKGIKRCERY